MQLRKDGDVFFRCPFCWSKYSKRNGEPLKNAKSKYHSVSEYIKLNPDSVEVRDNKATIKLLGKDIPCDVGRFPEDKVGFVIIS